MIVVMPNAYNRFKGSMYSSSVTIGDWETFIAKELVDYIDSNYRTIPRTESRISRSFDGWIWHNTTGHEISRCLFCHLYLKCLLHGGSSLPQSGVYEKY